MEGQTFQEVEAALESLYPGKDAKQAIKAATDAFAQVGTRDRRAIDGWCIACTRDMYRRMLEIGDFAGALKAIKLLHEFVGKTTPPPTDPAELQIIL